MDKYEILDYIIQSKTSMDSMSDDLVSRCYSAFFDEHLRREMVKRLKKIQKERTY